ncbi:hypothetical protein EQG41_04585 [Billgrantia azerbaijanica]|nr:hypothetical protein EQG41_04585 [Halomonas azerbaijanica]
MQRRTFLERTLVGGALLALSGCGFRLRGRDAGGPATGAVALSGPRGELTERLAERLRASGTRVDEGAPWVLNLGRETFREHRLSVLDAGTRELEMQLTVPFSVQRQADGAYRLPQQTLEVSRRLTVSDDNLLAQEQQREETRRELRDEAVRQLLERLRSLDEA